MGEEFSIPPSLYADMPAAVKEDILGLDIEKQKLFIDDFSRMAKSKNVCYIAWLLFGIHYGYLGSWKTQIVFWMTGGGLLIWWLADLFRIPQMVKSFNITAADGLVWDLK